MYNNWEKCKRNKNNLMTQGNFGIMRKNDKKFDNYRKNCKLIEIYCLRENMKNKNGLKKRQKWEKLIKKKFF